MAQYDVCAGNRIRGFVVVLQSDFLDDLPTVAVAPLLPDGLDTVKLGRLHPILEVAGKRYVMATHLITGVSKSELKPPVANLLSRHDDIARAVYMLFQGF